MQFFLGLELFLCFLSANGVLKSLSNPNFFLHQLCLTRIPRQMNSSAFMRSLLCGEKLRDPKLLQLLSDSSLIHLVVVSGSHFLVLLWLVERMRAPRALQFLVILGYWALTSAQAPGLFALLLWVLRQSPAVSLTSVQRVLLAGCGSFLVDFTTLQSASLYLTWLCCLTLALSSDFKAKGPSRPGHVHCVIYFAINLLGGWSVWTHPLGLILNLTLGTLLSLGLFPLGIWVALTQQGAGLFDWLMLQTQWLLQNLGQPHTQRPWVWTPVWWFYIFILHFGIQIYFEQQQKGKIRG